MYNTREKALTPDFKEKINAALVNVIYQQAKLSFLASWICATVVFIYLHYFKSTPLFYVYIWYGFFLFVILLRTLLVNWFLYTKSSQSHRYFFWRNLFIVGALLSGISWGLVGTPLLLPDHAQQQSLIIIILAGVCAGSVSAFSPIRLSVVAFLIPAITPLIFTFIASDTFINIFMVITFIAFLSYLILLANRTHQVIKNSLQLQFENDSLIINLSDTKNRLELMNTNLKRDATHDPLTHVANRSLFEANLEAGIKAAKEKHTILALLYLDLDGFKNINDTYGHEAGDQLLLIVVARLKNILRGEDILSRLGGDELAIVLENMEDVQAVADIADRVCHSIATPITLKDAEVQVYVSIGIAIYPTDGEDMNTLLRVADRAMYYTKDHGGNNYHFNVQLNVK